MGIVVLHLPLQAIHRWLIIFAKDILSMACVLVTGEMKQTALVCWSSVETARRLDGCMGNGQPRTKSTFRLGTRTSIATRNRSGGGAVEGTNRRAGG